MRILVFYVAFVAGWLDGALHQCGKGLSDSFRAGFEKGIDATGWIEVGSVRYWNEGLQKWTRKAS